MLNHTTSKLITLSILILLTGCQSLVDQIPNIPDFPSNKTDNSGANPKDSQNNSNTQGSGKSTKTPPPEIDQAKIDQALMSALHDKTDQGKKSHFRLIEAMIASNQTHAALSHLDSFQQNWGTTPDSQQLKAEALRKTRQFNQAEAIYKSLVESEADNQKAWYGLGRIAIEQGNLESAVSHLEKAVSINPEDLEANADLGLVHMLLNHKDLSLKALEKANQLAGNTSDTLSKLALWGLVFQELDIAQQVATRLNWDETTRNQALSQAAKIREQFIKYDRLLP